MIVTIEELGLQLKPYRGSTCWQLYEYATGRRCKGGNPLPDAWLPVECYPSTLEHGLQVVLERCARRSEVVGGLREAIAEVQRVQKAIETAADRLVSAEEGSKGPEGGLAR